MKPLKCTEHGQLVAELALGRLESERAQAAEQARVDCPSCSLWWAGEFDNDETERVEMEVGKVFASFQKPAQNHLAHWSKAAAVIVLLGSGGGLFWLGGSGNTPTQAPGIQAPPVTHSSEASLPDSGVQADVVFSSSFETGDLSGWTRKEG